MITTQVHPSKDAEISAHSIGGWYIYQSGKSNFMNIGCWDWPTMPYHGYYGYQARMLMKFDLPALPSTSVVSTAKLNIYLGSNNAMHSWNDGLYTYNQNPTIDIHQLLQDWDEGSGDGQHDGYQWSGATWTNRTAQGYGWSQYGGYFNPTPAVSKTIPYAYNWVQFDITSLVNSWYASPSTNYGLVLKYHNDTTLQGSMYTFSREYGDSMSPYIEVAYNTAPERARGLSPNFNSTISPQIPGSSLLKWTYVNYINTVGNPVDEADSQSQAIITLSRVNVDNTRTLIGTYTITGNQNYYDISGLGLTNGTTYEWSVVTYGNTNLASPPSEKVLFKYKVLTSYPGAPTWQTLPSLGQTVNHTYLTEIRTNLHNEVTKYSNMDTNIVDALFQTIIPSRTDYDNFNKIMTKIYAAHSLNYTSPNLGLTFGIGTIISLRNIIDAAYNLTPLPVQGATSVMTNGAFHAPTDFIVTHAANTDSAVGLSWSASTFTSSGLDITLQQSTDTNVYYYKVQYQQKYIDSLHIYSMDLYFTADQLASPIHVSLLDPTTAHTFTVTSLNKNHQSSTSIPIVIAGVNNVSI